MNYSNEYSIDNRFTHGSCIYISKSSHLVMGTADDDVLIAGSHWSMLVGDTGKDRFVPKPDTTTMVMDFKREEGDKIDLSAYAIDKDHLQARMKSVGESTSLPFARDGGSLMIWGHQPEDLQRDDFILRPDIENGVTPLIGLCPLLPPDQAL
ncbi:hypothetical protein ACFQU1_19430 [Chelatococcus sp. GCM10030263]|uniref:hypothetical protein n=1 Tax=Chelatococcus sp. GCM10030263 TaxID=3273387 RepID=UPI003618E3AD